MSTNPSDELHAAKLALLLAALDGDDARAHAILNRPDRPGWAEALAHRSQLRDLWY